MRVIPANVVAHPALFGGFVLLAFADEPTVVHIEGRMSGMFPENRDGIADHKLVTERLTGLAADGQKSVRLLHAIAKDLERAR